MGHLRARRHRETLTQYGVSRAGLLRPRSEIQYVDKPIPAVRTEAREQIVEVPQVMYEDWICTKGSCGPQIQTSTEDAKREIGPYERPMRARPRKCLHKKQPRERQRGHPQRSLSLFSTLQGLPMHPKIFLRLFFRNNLTRLELTSEVKNIFKPCFKGILGIFDHLLK